MWIINSLNLCSQNVFNHNVKGGKNFTVNQFVGVARKWELKWLVHATNPVMYYLNSMCSNFIILGFCVRYFINLYPKIFFQVILKIWSLYFVAFGIQSLTSEYNKKLVIASNFMDVNIIFIFINIKSCLRFERDAFFTSIPCLLWCFIVKQKTGVRVRQHICTWPCFQSGFL